LRGLREDVWDGIDISIAHSDGERCRPLARAGKGTGDLARSSVVLGLTPEASRIPPAPRAERRRLGWNRYFDRSLWRRTMPPARAGWERNGKSGAIVGSPRAHARGEQNSARSAG